MLHGIWLERRLCPLNSLDSKAAVGIVWLAKLVIISCLTAKILIHQISTVLNVGVEFETLN